MLTSGPCGASLVCPREKKRASFLCFALRGKMFCRNGSDQVAGQLLSLWCNKGSFARSLCRSRLSVLFTQTASEGCEPCFDDNTFFLLSPPQILLLHIHICMRACICVVQCEPPFVVCVCVFFCTICTENIYIFFKIRLHICVELTWLAL